MKKLFFLLSFAQIFLMTGVFAARGGHAMEGGHHNLDQEQRYMREKEQFRRYDEGGAVVNPGWGGGGGAYVAPQNADPAYDSAIDEDMLFDSYHK